ncbi:MAG: tripartite tricarboxylate transporter substrate binding protein [Burkholderiales bacterium]
MRHTMRSALLALPLIAASAAAPSQQADYPSRPIRMLVGQTPGGPTDIPARLLAQRLSERLGQAVVVENRPGAASNIATEAVAKSAKDGYTVLMISPQHVTNPLLYPSLPFDPVKDFAPVSLVSKVALVLVTHPDVPAKTLTELLAYLQSRPGAINWSSAGNGGTGHLALELFRAASGVNVVHVPFKGAQPALTELIAGRVQMGFDSVSTADPHVRAGRLQPIGVTSTTRSPLLPQVPTLAEAGLAGYEAVGYAALLAPAGVPASVVDRLSRETAAIMREPETRERLIRIGMAPIGSRPEELAQFLSAETIKWSKIVRDANIKAE